MGKGDHFRIDDRYESPCEVCGTLHNRKYSVDIADKSVCAMCRRYKHMIHALRFVEYMADQDCQQMIDWQGVYWSDMEEGRHEGLYCQLDCSCDTCSARKVLRFIRAMQRTF